MAGSFQRLLKAGLLGKEYNDVYFLKKIIRNGDYCVDIGAHLGYFTLELGRRVGPTGKVYAIEPMSSFNNTLTRLLRRKNADNVTLYKVALGGNGEYVDMGIPKVGDSKRFAYARVKESSPTLDFVESERVKNESGDNLFLDLPRLDYIKCDVEGLEFQVFSSFTKTLEKHHPILLCELFDRNLLINLFDLLKPFGYKAYELERETLLPLDAYKEGQIASKNYYFIPQEAEERLRPFIKA